MKQDQFFQYLTREESPELDHDSEECLAIVTCPTPGQYELEPEVWAQVGQTRGTVSDVRHAIENYCDVEGRYWIVQDGEFLEYTQGSDGTWNTNGTCTIEDLI